ncbi:hypothetical protein B0H13DRAFT_2347875 [Mycena leptocephala]|nr:hypothetical protein B0H13DRAFT_2347875 [Mycena leptocephala]
MPAAVHTDTLSRSQDDECNCENEGKLRPIRMHTRPNPHPPLCLDYLSVRVRKEEKCARGGDAEDDGEGDMLAQAPALFHLCEWAGAYAYRHSLRAARSIPHSRGDGEREEEGERGDEDESESESESGWAEREGTKPQTKPEGEGRMYAYLQPCSSTSHVTPNLRDVAEVILPRNELTKTISVSGIETHPEFHTWNGGGDRGKRQAAQS